MVKMSCNCKKSIFRLTELNVCNLEIGDEVFNSNVTYIVTGIFHDGIEIETLQRTHLIGRFSYGYFEFYNIDCNNCNKICKNRHNGGT